MTSSEVVPGNPLRLLVIGRAALVAENLAPRRQLAVLQRHAPRRQAERRDARQPAAAQIPAASTGNSCDHFTGMAIGAQVVVPRTRPDR